MSESRVARPAGFGNAFAADTPRASDRDDRRKELQVDEDRIKGKSKEVEGEAQQKWGEAKDKAEDAKEEVRDRM